MLFDEWTLARENFGKAEDRWLKLQCRALECEWDRTPDLSPSALILERARQDAQSRANDLRNLADKMKPEFRRSTEYILGKNGF